MKAKELRNKEQKELVEILKSARKKLSDIKFEFATKKLKNNKEMRTMKKDVARILTLINEKKN